MRIASSALLLVAIATLALSGTPAAAQGPIARKLMGVPGDRIPFYGDDRYAWARAQQYTWHGQHRYTQWGMPAALVVPPTAGLTTNYGWGVTNTRVRRVDHQFYRDHLGAGQGNSGYRSTPYWPSDTTQFGVYPVRGPW